ncbi:MAG: ABC transporter ATP-binding protein [Rhizobiales bacterium]|nr:ABC transporter ATP-binding protein [Hyphomicrobiales bacterium]
MLEVRNIQKNFGGVRAVGGVSLNVDAGKIIGVIGPNGAGKTTLFNVVSGFLPADGGSAIFEGSDILGLRPHDVARRGVLRTFQTPTGFPRMTVLENMLVFLKDKQTGIAHALGSRRIAGTISRDESDRAQQVLELFGLAQKRDLWVQELGAPELKMLEFARTVMASPKILLLDEPAAGVNVALLDNLVDTIFRLRDDGVTFLIVDHNLSFICRICDYIYAMADGEVISQGGPDDVVNDQAVIECYIGTGAGAVLNAGETKPEPKSIKTRRRTTKRAKTKSDQKAPEK